MRCRDGRFTGASLETQGRELVERLNGHWQARRGGMCRCPAHEDRTPSLSVRPGHRRLLFHCFAGCESGAVMRALAALGLPSPSAAWETARVPARRAGRRGNTSAAASRLWAAARPIVGSPAEAYLRGRGLDITASDLRFHPRTPRGRGAQAVFGPAMLAAVRDGRELVAVHRTFLDGRSATLAGIPRARRALGPLGRGAVRLWPPDGETLGWAEGIETAMAASLLTGIPCWATLGAERFGRVALPASVRRLILFLDNDSGGRRAERLAREAVDRSPVELEARFAGPRGADWNDVLLSSIG